MRMNYNSLTNFAGDLGSTNSQKDKFPNNVLCNIHDSVLGLPVVPDTFKGLHVFQNKK